MNEEDSEDYSSDDSELDDLEEDEDGEDMGEDLYGDYRVGDIGRRDEFLDRESMQPNFPPFEAQNNINHFEFEK